MGKDAKKTETNKEVVRHIYIETVFGPGFELIQRARSRVNTRFN